jgi:outer membrane receptor protein involved in Fe transport
MPYIKSQDVFNLTKRPRVPSNASYILRFSIMISWAGLCWSQESPLASDSAQSGRGRILEEVIVSATKQDMNLRDIPASITALLGEDIESLGVQSMEEITRLVPGVNITQPGDGPARVTIRGISANANTNATTGVMLGNVSLVDAYIQQVSVDPNPFDLKTVEVLKGPQGTLFGAGALNGAIRYVPETPKFDIWEFKYFAQYTEVKEGGDDPTYGIALNAPIADSAAIRIVAVERRSPGWIDNTKLDDKDNNWVEQSAFRGMIAWDAAERLSVNILFAQQITDSIDTPVADNGDGNLKNDTKPRLSPHNDRYDLLGFSMNYNLDWGTFAYESSKLDKRWDLFTDGADVPITGGGSIGNSNTVSHELRLTSNEDEFQKWRWVTGIVGWRQEYLANLTISSELAINEETGLLDVGITGLAGLLDGGGILSGGKLNLATLEVDVEIEEAAWFGNVTRYLGDWEMSVGGRYYKTKSGGSSDASGLLLILAEGQTSRRFEDEIKEEGFNPKISVTWHPSDNVMTFLAASRGFRIGGIQFGVTPVGSNPPPPVFKTDTLWNYEFGVRTEWLEKTLRFDITAYKVDWQDPQVFQLHSSGIGSYIDNVGGVKSEGAEISFQYLAPFLGMTISTSASYADTVTTESFDGSDGMPVAPGARWPFAPRFGYFANISWLINVGSWGIVPSITRTYIGEAYSDVTTANAQSVFDYGQWDAQVNFSSLALEWFPNFSININNITDERGVTNHWEGGLNPASPVTNYTYIRPKAITFRVSGKF